MEDRNEINGYSFILFGIVHYFFYNEAELLISNVASVFLLYLHNCYGRAGGNAWPR